MYDLYYGNQTLPTKAKVLAKISEEEEIEANREAVEKWESTNPYGKKVLPSLRYAKKNGWKSVVIVEF